MSASDILKKDTKVAKASKANKSARAEQIAETIAEAAKTSGISKIVFDRGGYRYHGRVKTLAESLRKHGLNF